MRTSVLVVILAFAAAQATPAFRDVALKWLFPNGIVDSHIVNGKEATPHMLPWQVLIASMLPGGKKMAQCGGAVIDAEWILTAAHCLREVQSVHVILGAHNIKMKESTLQLIRAQDWIIHDNWRDGNDIALIRLSTPARLNKYVQVIKLPSENQKEETFAGQKGIMSGWGLTSTKGQSSDVLLYATEQVISQAECQRYFPPSLLGRSRICVSGKRATGTCQGDSGGPLVVVGEDNEPILIGVTNFGSAKGCESGYPTAFARVTYFLDWIKQITGITQ